MEAHTNTRPTLQRTWTEYQNLEGFPKTAFRLAPSPPLSTSPMSPGSLLPSPILPLSARYDTAVREQQVAMVKSLDSQGNQISLVERTGAAWLPPMSAQRSLPPSQGNIGATSPSSSTQLPRRLSLVAETRSMLLTGLPHLAANGLVTSLDRRQSAPAINAHYQRRQNQVLLLQQLQAYGHNYYGNASSADVFVSATALRRPSITSSTGSDEEKPASHLTVRARVRPRAIERKPFVMQRTFDVEALRATVPEPGQAPAVPAQDARRLSVDLSARLSSLSVGRRSSNAKSGPTLLKASQRSLDFSAKAVPVHLDYARTFLPVLAALMMSGHVRTGDIIDLPLPHPMAWPQTVAYVYTGSGKLTAAVKENMLHLGGKV